MYKSHEMHLTSADMSIFHQNLAIFVISGIENEKCILQHSL